MDHMKVWTFKIRFDREGDPRYPQYERAEIMAETREQAGTQLEEEITKQIDTFHDDPDFVTWEEELLDVS